MKHTGETWEQRGSVVVSPGYGLICAMLEIYPDARGVARYTELDIGSPDWDEAMANCRLCAASPKLLKALDGIVKWMIEQDMSIPAHLAIAAEDAITKAKGG